MSENQQLIRRFIEAFSANDVDQLMPFFDDACVYHNIPVPAVKGPEAIRKVLEGFMNMSRETEFIVHHLAETDDGVVTISHSGCDLPARAFHKDGHVQQAAIVDNKLLEGALQHTKKLQQERDAEKVAKGSVTKRAKRLLRQRQDEAQAHP